jgi:hypothetical protein
VVNSLALTCDVSALAGGAGEPPTMPGLTAKYLRTAPGSARKRDIAMDAADEARSVSSDGSAHEDAPTSARSIGSIEQPRTGFGRPSWRVAWRFLESR